MFGLLGSGTQTPDATYGGLLDPNAARYAGIAAALSQLGAAYAPSTDPGAQARGIAQVGPAMQQAQQGVMQQALMQHQMRTYGQNARRESDINDAISAKGDDQISPGARQYRGLLSNLPERARAALPLLSEKDRGDFLSRILAQSPRQNVVVGPGGHLVDSATGQSLFAAPQAPQRAPLPGPYDHFRVMPDGSIVDMRQLSGGGGGGGAPRPASAPASPQGMPPLASPSMTLPAPGAGGQAMPPAAAGGGEVTPAQMTLPGAAPAAALPPGTVRPPTQRPGETERLYQRYEALLNKPDRTPAETAVMEALRGRLGAERTVDRGPSAFDNDRGKEIAATVTQIERAGRAAPNTIMRLGQIERDLERVTTGVGSGAAITVGQLAQRFGVPDSALAAVGLDRTTTASAENIRSLSMSLIQATLASGEFPSQNFSNADLTTLQQANPGLFNSPAGNRAIIAVQRAMAERNAEIAREWTEWKKGNGGGMDSAQRFLDERMPQIAARDVLAPILKDFRGAPAQPQMPPDTQRPMPAASSLAVPLGNSGMTASPPPAATGGWSIRPR